MGRLGGFALFSLLYFLHCIGTSHCLDITDFEVPRLVHSGSSVRLTCAFLLRADHRLYSLAWWKDDRIFYKYTPRNDDNLQDGGRKREYTPRDDEDVQQEEAAERRQWRETSKRSNDKDGSIFYKYTPKIDDNLQDDLQDAVQEEGRIRREEKRSTYQDASNFYKLKTSNNKDLQAEFARTRNSDDLQEEGEGQGKRRLREKRKRRRRSDKYVFDTPGILVDKANSTLNEVILSRVDHRASGQLRCEVLSDYPYFEKDSRGANMTVLDIPGNSPTITGMKDKYKVGELLLLNCSSPHSFPPSIITWYINGKLASHETVVVYPGEKDYDGCEATWSGLQMLLLQQYFNQEGELILTCTARILEVYKESVSVVITDAGYFPTPSLLDHTTTSTANTPRTKRKQVQVMLLVFLLHLAT